MKAAPTPSTARTMQNLGSGLEDPVGQQDPSPAPAPAPADEVVVAAGEAHWRSMRRVWDAATLNFGRHEQLVARHQATTDGGANTLARPRLVEVVVRCVD